MKITDSDLYQSVPKAEDLWLKDEAAHSGAAARAGNQKADACRETDCSGHADFYHAQLFRPDVCRCVPRKVY